jgi:hypothetical protein
LIEELNLTDQVTDPTNGAFKEKLKGTRMRKDFFRETFGVNWTYDSDLKRKTLDIWRNELNKIADLSFGYRIDEKYIYIVAYKPTKNLIDNNLIGSEEAKIKSAITFKMKNKDLTPHDAMILLEIYLKYSYKVVYKATERKTALKDVNGQPYMVLFQQLVETYVKQQNLDVQQLTYANAREMRTNIRKGYTL